MKKNPPLRNLLRSDMPALGFISTTVGSLAYRPK